MAGGFNNALMDAGDFVHHQVLATLLEVKFPVTLNQNSKIKNQGSSCVRLKHLQSLNTHHCASMLYWNIFICVTCENCFLT